MNAGCFGKEFKDILISVQAIDNFGRVITIPSKDIKFEYRKNNIPDDYIFLSASFKGTKSNQKIEDVINKFKFEKEKINLLESKQVEALLESNIANR